MLQLLTFVKFQIDYCPIRFALATILQTNSLIICTLIQHNKRHTILRNISVLPLKRSDGCILSIFI